MPDRVSVGDGVLAQHTEVTRCKRPVTRDMASLHSTPRLRGANGMVVNIPDRALNHGRAGLEPAPTVDMFQNNHMPDRV